MEISAKAFILDWYEISSRLKLVLLYHTAANLYVKQGKPVSIPLCNNDKGYKRGSMLH